MSGTGGREGMSDDADSGDLLHWLDPPVDKDLRFLTVRVWRGDETGAYQEYRVPRRDNQTVLDVLTHIQRHLDPGLAFRFSCRVGMCGSCAMLVNGTSRWTCRTRVDKVLGLGALTLAPLRNFPVIKDLCVDMSEFFDGVQRAEGRFVPKEPGARDFHSIPPGSRRRRRIDEAIECIGCGICHSACESVLANKEFLGPAALNRAWTLVNDDRDGAGRARLLAVAGDAGCQSCHSHQSCAQDCPKHLNPTRSIAGLKRAVAWATLTGRLTK